MKIFVVHVYDAAGQLHDYSVHGTIEGAVRRASTDVVVGNFKETDEALIDRVVAAVSKEEGTERMHVSCEAWRAHVDEMQLSEDLFGRDAGATARSLCEAATPPPWRAVGSKPPHVVYVHATGVTPYVAKLHDSANGAANAAFVAAARALVPALLDEIERLREATQEALPKRTVDAAWHTCSTRGCSGCDSCMRLEKELWDAINDYAVSVGGDPARHVYGNTPRMRAVVAVSRIVAGEAYRQQIDDVTIEMLAKGSSAVEARACELTHALRTKEQQYRHLQRLYAESRDYVSTLRRERDELVEAAQHNEPSVENTRLRAVLIDTRGFLRGFALRPELGCGAQDLLDEAVMLDRVLDETKGER